MKKAYFKAKDLMELEGLCIGELFPGLPVIPVGYGLRDKMNDAMGMFHMEEADGYREQDDEFLFDPGYRSIYIPLYGNVGIEHNRELSWTHPLNYPDVSILLSRSIADSPLTVIGTLLHELMHYYCWYCGFEDSDDSIDFNNRLKATGIPSSDDFRWSYEECRWIDSFDYETLRPFLDLWLDRKAQARKKPRAA